MTSRNYCFTSFTSLEADALRECPLRKYIICGEETCPKTGKKHIQGYIELNNSYRITALKNYAPTTHFEKRKGTQQQAINYCKKENKWLEFGELAKQGKRNDILSLKSDIDEGMSTKEISEKHFSSFLRYERGINNYKVLHEEPRNFVTELHIYWGPPGSGKSKKAFEQDPNAYWLMKPNGNSVFFDGYSNQETIIIDDFYGWLPYDLLLRMADRYPLRVQIKNGSANFHPKKIIITSNSPWHDWYKNPNCNLGALERRITSIEFIDLQIQKT